MKKHLSIFLILLFPIFVFSQNVEVEGGFIVDSIDVSSGLVKNVADPISAQDAATKAYVDLLEVKVVLLTNFLVNEFSLNVQQRLDLGETPIEIYNSENSLLDSLYGKTYQGGLITYLNTATGTGLVGAPTDQSTGAEWGCVGTPIGGTNQTIGSGQANSTAIVNGCGEAGIAAKLCNDLVVGIYDDWFLPSKDELNLMWENLADSDGDGNNSGPADPDNLGGFANWFYWSSSEVGDFFAWRQGFDNGTQNVGDKNDDLGRVRAIRVF